MTFDYIIAGAGSAGCVLADKLSENGQHQVLLIEAGGKDDSMFIHMPKGIPKLMGDPRYNHIYQVEPDEGNAGRGEVWVRGNTLGGSSSINGMVYNRGQPEDYDHLEELGCTGWNWNSLLPHFKAVEDHPLGASPIRGSGGPLRISVPQTTSPLADAVIKAGTSLGLKNLEDMNDLHGKGAVGLMPHTISRGKRMSTAATFLQRAANRTNLTVVTGKRIDKLLLEGTKAVGVLCADGTEYKAGREVLVTAGALESPGILMRSGIGPADKLRALGIEVVHDAPEVGQNLMEHIVLSGRYGVNSYKFSENNAYSGLRLIANAARYLATRSGLMARGSFEAGVFLRATESALRPNAFLLIAPFAFDPSKFPLGMVDYPAISLFESILRPTSRGSIELKSADPTDKPVIRANYLATDHDRQIALGTTRFVRKLVATKPLSDVITTEYNPGLDAQSDDEIIAAWRGTGSTGYHTIGTCGMGSRETSVVDPELRVRGVQGVRVMDASVLPYMVSGNTNAPVIAMAHRTAELIAQSGWPANR